jgi:hypothetical protein
MTQCVNKRRKLTKIGILADFGHAKTVFAGFGILLGGMGACSDFEKWSPETGLNCRPLHYQ